MIQPIYRYRSGAAKGVALVVGLAMLVLVLGLCIAFLSRVSVERVSSSSNSNSAGARLLADTAVQLVQGQIDAATTQGTKVAWTSQPGLVRTFDDAGRPLKSYKLYSAAAMQADGALKPAEEAAALAQWYDAPALYTDINAPVSLTDPASGQATRIWPVLDPTSFATHGTSQPPPQGFSISGEAPVGPSHGSTNPAPMPVMWLYVLKDGRVVAPAGSGSVVTVSGASAANPVVGRIAFWTDDETCKVNVNTASEGTYWDVPKANTNQEVNFGFCQPSANEFQAFPGHPATTSLSAVFTAPSWLAPTVSSPYDPAHTGNAAKAIFDLVPRLQSGGSLAGTSVTTATAGVINLDTDRLIPNRQEILFAVNGSDPRQRNPELTRETILRNGFFLTTSSRAPEVNLFNLPKIACWPIHADLAANPASPWATAFDRLIAFCGTLNNQSYYFQRRDSHSPTADFSGIQRNTILYSYLQDLMAREVPGFGGDLASKFGADSDQVLTQIFDYIRSTNLWDGNLAGKTSSSTSYTFTEGKSSPTSTTLFPGHGQVTPISINNAGGVTQGFGRFNTISEVAVQFICTADPTPITDPGDSSKQIANPSNDPATNLTLSVPLERNVAAGTKQIRIEALAVLEHFCVMHGYGSMRPDEEIKIEGLDAWTVQGNADGGPVSLGFPSEAQQTESNAGVYRWRSQPNSSLCWGGPWGIRRPITASDHTKSNAAAAYGIRARNGGRLAEDPEFTQSTYKDNIKDRQYPFASEPVTIRVQSANPRMRFSGGPVTIRITDRVTGGLVQTMKVNFAGGDFPAPNVYVGPPYAPKLSQVNSGLTPDTAGSLWWTFQTNGAVAGHKGRLSTWAGKAYHIFLDTDSVRYPGINFDVVRSMIPVDATGGRTLDYRLLAANPSVEASQFVKHPDYDTDSYLVSSLTEILHGQDNNFGVVRGALTNLSYPDTKKPDLPLPVPSAVATGDWDNGISYGHDGPFINKPDEGNAQNISDASKPPYFGSINPATGQYSSLFTSPNRVMPSPGMFGSLPTGVKRNQGWQTLLFRRQPGHPGYNAAAGGFIADPDYLMLDLFWMPVVQPYAISEPLSTAGKINMNVQIIPFTYITRETGLYAVMKNEKVMAIPNGDVSIYKAETQSGGNPTHSDHQYRRSLNIPAILKQFQFRYDDSDKTGLYAFRSPAEICDIHIVPDNANVSTNDKQSMDNDMADYWSNHALTGDNSRERPYVTIYPRLTTKSNTFTVHFRAQALKKRPGSAPQTWNEKTDVITADYRGSATIDRFVNPSDSAIPDYAASPNTSPTLDKFYHWRTRAYHQFAP